MKANIGTAALALAACTVFAPASHAQTLEVHESGTGNETVDHWRPDYWHSYSRDYHQTKKLRIMVRDMSRRSPDGEVRVYFIGRKQPELDLFIYNHSVVQVHFGGDMEVREEIEAPSLFLHETRYWDGDHYSHGAAMEGWIAEARVGSRVFGTVASSQKLLAIARSDELQKMIAAAHLYEPQPKPDDSHAAIHSPSAAPPVPAAPKASPAEVATLIAPIEIKITYGKTTLPRGTKLKVVSRDSKTVTAVYLDQPISIPIASTDLK